MAQQTVLSASRRTDIPARYMDWFMDSVDAGCFKVVNPYNRRVSVVPATPDQVHTIVFWSKDYGPFLQGGFGDRLTAMGYNLFFNMTLNSRVALLEPNIPGTSERIAQLAELCGRNPPEAVTWRFDPICFYRTDDGQIRHNMGEFETIARAASRAGVRRCVTSFMDHYPKIRRRAKSKPGFSFIDPTLERKRTILLWMHQVLSSEGIALYTCCEPEVSEILPADVGIGGGACVPNDLIMGIYGGNLSLKRDAGQRVKQGCGCSVSVDIGSYHLHPCRNNCLYCYANPAPPESREAPLES